jgi:hypothetical protein
VEANTPANLRAGSADTMVENRKHCVTGVNDVSSEGRIGHEQPRQEAPIPIS